MFALVDCNNFYASCERVFRPELKDKPVLVLSNNDGCVIARSNEVKKLGIGMGLPAYQIQEAVDKYNISVFSSNYTLYGDMSNRVMMLLSEMAPEIEIYSIDEAFLNLSDFKYENLKDLGSRIIRVVTRGTGIPVSMGVASTKTLAKIASRFAKRYPKYEGVCVIDTEEKRKKALQLTKVGDVWGIGSRNEKKLKALGVNTAYDFSLMPSKTVRRLMTITGEYTWRELNGECCIEMELAPPSKKQICTSRSFGAMLTNIEDISQAVAYYTAQCASKLRKQNSCAASLMVFIHTNYFRSDLPQYGKSTTVQLPVPTADTMELTQYALSGLNTIFAQGYKYKKAGVIITEIVSGNFIQSNLFDTVDRSRQNKLMKVLDQINNQEGKQLVKLAVQGTKGNWNLKREKLSPCYTTRMNDLIKVKNI